jgi:hypothetical protein
MPPLTSSRSWQTRGISERHASGRSRCREWPVRYTLATELLGSTGVTPGCDLVPLSLAACISCTSSDTPIPPRISPSCEHVQSWRLSLFRNAVSVNTFDRSGRPRAPGFFCGGVNKRGARRGMVRVTERPRYCAFENLVPYSPAHVDMIDDRPSVLLMGRKRPASRTESGRGYAPIGLRTIVLRFVPCLGQCTFRVSTFSNKRGLSR